MWTKTFVCAAALMIAGSIFVYAQQGPGEPGASGENKDAASTERNSAMQSEDRAAFADARIAALHAGLKFNADRRGTGQLLSRHCVNLLNCGRIDLRAISSLPLIQLRDCSA